MSEEYRIEHRNHLMYVAGCPYCLKRAHDAGESPAPLVATDVGVFCLLHGTYDCAEPSCWRCGNHTMDEWQRCSDPRCQSTNTQFARDVVRESAANWERVGVAGPAPSEYLAACIGQAHIEFVMEKARMLSRAGRHSVGPEGEQAHPAPPPYKDLADDPRNWHKE